MRNNKEEKIKKLLKTKCFGKNIEIYKKLPSTNDLAKSRAEALAEGSIIIAQIQTSGRGRHDRTWFSPEGGLWFSLILKPKNIKNLIEINYVAVISAINVLRKDYKVGCLYRWPNDLMLDGKKLGGILTESKFSGNILSYAVLGIGLNVNMGEFPVELMKTATSLYLLQNKIIDKEELLCKILKELEENYFTWGKNGIKPFRDKISDYCHTIGKRVKISLEDRVLTGDALNIEKDGALKIRLDDEKLTNIYSCEKLEEI